MKILFFLGRGAGDPRVPAGVNKTGAGWARVPILGSNAGAGWARVTVTSPISYSATRYCNFCHSLRSY